MLLKRLMPTGKGDGASLCVLLEPIFTLPPRSKDQKIGEGTYAVVYRGNVPARKTHIFRRSWPTFIGREIATGKKVAIKKIKVGQFKDGLDMSAIREVKFLRELKHQNVIEVRLLLLPHSQRRAHLNSFWTSSRLRRTSTLCWSSSTPTWSWSSRTGLSFSSQPISRAGWP